MYIETTVKGDTIIIEEYEKNGICDCNCLFDLDIELQGVIAGKYQIKFIEPYAIGQQEILFEVDLTTNESGGYCVTRKKYPWGS